MGDAKIKVNLKEGTVELEGSEEFVKSYWEKISTSLKNMPAIHSEHLPPINPQGSGTLKSGQKKKSKKNKSRVKPDLTLIPLDLKEKNGKISFKKLFEEKKPSSNQEIITLFSYYLTKYLKISDMKYGHALFCYNEVRKPKPTNISQLFRDTVSLKKWVEVGSQPHTIKLSIAGENLVEHELPASGNTKKKNK